MRGVGLTALCGVLALGLSACGDADEKTADSNVAANGAATETASGNSVAGAAEANTASAWPQGSRIVEEGGVTYRVDSGGTRVRLGPNDSRIVVAEGVRYRVDPGGARVRIDRDGTAVRIGESTITGNAPNGRSDVETPGEAVTDVGEDAVEAVGDAIPD